MDSSSEGHNTGILIPPPYSPNDSESDEIFTPESDNEFGELSIPLSAILRELYGVTVATKAAEGELGRITHILTGETDAHIFSGDFSARTLNGWCTYIDALTFDESQRHRARLAASVAFLCEASRKSIIVGAEDLSFVWHVIYEALASPSVSYSISRSSQGFLVVPLSSIIKDGNIEELFRLHVWEAGGRRMASDLSIHAHQPFLQSWILAGEGRDYTYESHPADSSTATHAEYGVSWSAAGAEKSGKDYKTHQTSSTIVNRGRLVHVVEKASKCHTYNMTYTIPANALHKSEVAPDILHATLALFDSHRGFYQDAPVLGPVDGVSYTSRREAPDVTASTLVKAVDSVREWERTISQGLQHTANGEWEEALRSYRKASNICESNPHFPDAPHYRHAVTLRLGHMHRVLGRIELARKILEEARSQMPLNQLRVEITGELAVVYLQHENRLDDAKEALEDQYSTAKHLGLDREVCRAIGNLGMVNYQLYLRRKEPSLLDTAMSQLAERVEVARKLKKYAVEQLSDPRARAELLKFASLREAIALGRFSLCYQQKGDVDQAISTALESLNIQLGLKNPVFIGIARGFYAMALLFGGRSEEALKQCNRPNACSPIISMCKEPSDEYRGYIRRLVQAGADPELRDEQGYSALDCAVYSGDTKTQEIIEEALRRKFLREAESEAERKLDGQRYEAVLRKGYRDIFQDKLHHILLSSDHGSIPEKLRRVYAETLDADEEKARLFDRLKFVRYTDLLQFGRIPRSSDGLTSRFNIKSDSNDDELFIIFLSYRWIAADRGSSRKNDSPDDAANTQYHRMIRALRQFLDLHPNISMERLGVWIDFACIDQEDLVQQQKGVSALLMNLIQCNAMISLVDHTYYERSWCSLEVLMIQILKNAYGGHLWYEHVVDQARGDEYLREGPTSSELAIDLSQKKVTYPSDHPRLLFLERQTKLIS
ncbi:Mitochondrial-processing peptidase subunit beta [Hypoxylon texense]